MPKKKEMEFSEKKCLTPKCDREGVRRGLCPSCRVAASRAIKAGETTESDLVREGLIAPKASKRGKFAVALEAIKQRKSPDEKDSATNSSN